MNNCTSYIERGLTPTLVRAVRDFPVVVLQGPRQSGKTTLLRHVFGESHRYVSLDSPEARAFAREDPRGFLAHHAPPVIIDEAQYAPDLFSHIKMRVDQARSRKGQFLLTGSQNYLMMERVTESLAGRAALLRLHSLSYREASGRAHEPFAWESPLPQDTRRTHARRERDRDVRTTLSVGRFWTRCVRGGYPELEIEPDRDPALWFESYVQTYLERDVRTLRQIGDLLAFQGFLRLLASRTAQLLDFAAISRDLGVALNTVRAWLSVLVASFQVIVLRPYAANLGKRLVRTPKVYFTDLGTVCHLTGVRTAEHAARGPLAGALFENAVLLELVKTYEARGLEPPVSFFRTSAGLEVDFLVEARPLGPGSSSFVALEAKSTSTPRARDGTNLLKFRDVLGDPRGEGDYVVHLGDAGTGAEPLGAGVLALPFAGL